MSRKVLGYAILVVVALIALLIGLRTIFGPNLTAMHEGKGGNEEQGTPKAGQPVTVEGTFSSDESRILLDQSNMEMHQELWAYRRISRDTRDAAVARLRRNEVAVELGGAFMALAYVGIDADASVISDWIDHLKGVMSIPERTCFMRAMESLGLMTRRGLPAAKELLNKMAQYQYWASRDIRWYPEDLSPAQPKEYEALCHVCEALALSEDSNFPEVVARILKHAETAQHQIEIARFRVDHLRELARERLAKEKLSNPNIVEYLRKRSRSELPGGGTKTANGTVSPSHESAAQPVRSGRLAIAADSPEGREIEGAAAAAYERFEKAFRDGEFGSVADRLLDNLRPARISPAALKSEAYAPDLRTVQQLCQAIKEAKCEFKLAKDGIVIETSSSPYSKTIDETVSVTFIVQDAIPVVMKTAPNLLPGATLNRDGLLIQMRRINGEWHWNPFGW